MVTFGICLYIEDVAVSFSWIKYLFLIVTVIAVAMACFNYCLWRHKWLQGRLLNWFVKRPNIQGTWRVKIISSWVNPSTEQQIPPIEGYMVIRQTFTSLNMRLMTKDAYTEFFSVRIIYRPDQPYQIVGTYMHIPLFSVREQNAIHRGSVLLRLVGTPLFSIKGEYWTDRKTSGAMELTDRRSEIFDDFETAQEAFTSEKKHESK